MSRYFSSCTVCRVIQPSTRACASRLFLSLCFAPIDCGCRAQAALVNIGKAQRYVDFGQVVKVFPSLGFSPLGEMNTYRLLVCKDDERMSLAGHYFSIYC